MSTYDIAFDIGGMRFRAGLVDEQGRITSPVTFESPTTPEEVIDHVRRIVDSYSVTAPNAAVGISIGGMVETNGSVTSGAMHMMEYPLEERLALRRPVAIINDAKAAALAEAHFNPRLAGSSFVLITISNGIGGGIIIDGDLYGGNTGTAGEVGHMIIDRGLDFYCRLGHRGCLDALASGRALNNRMKKLWREGHWRHLEDDIEIRDLPGLLLAGDGMAGRLVQESAMWIGAGIMNLIRVLDPSEIVFKGSLIIELWQYFEPHIRAILTSYDRNIPMSLTSLGENVGLVGAGILARRARENAITR